MVWPCLTIVNVIIARGLLGVSAQELVYLPDHFQNHASHAYSRQEVFQLYVLTDIFFKLPINFPPFHSLLFLSFLFSFLQFVFELQDSCIVWKGFTCQSPSIDGGIVQAVRGRCM